jgi:guanosine-3',5'-bis(diphosphate) 3'-pyrophosphohydrolase
MSLSFLAMQFAMEVHKDQKRKYTNEPYFGHLAEVAGIVAATGIEMSSPFGSAIGRDYAIAVAWCHDSMEDQGVTAVQLERIGGWGLIDGVVWLSDMETLGNRAERKAKSRYRLSAAPSWVQSIKCADLISNTKSIVQFDPKFAVTYLEEKRLLLEVLTKADPRLREIAMRQAGA